VLQALAKAVAEEGQKEARAKGDATIAQQRAPRASPFVDGCNAFFRDPKTSRFAPPDPTGYCKCLGDRYLGVMTPAEEVFYADNFQAKFWRGIAQPSSTDPARPRLNPAAVSCRQ
jgi:hypothetical protein